MEDTQPEREHTNIQISSQINPTSMFDNDNLEPYKKNNKVANTIKYFVKILIILALGIIVGIMLSSCKESEKQKGLKDQNKIINQPKQVQKPKQGINEKGFWQGLSSHYFDQGLSKDLLEFYGKVGAKSILDLGCGKCTYAQKLQQKGFYVQGYDGNPQTPLISKFGKVLDLTEQHDLGKQFDWVQSFEVGEHVPTDHQDKFIGNIVRHAKKGIIISWAIPGQNGGGHINNKANGEVIAKLKPFGFYYDPDISTWMRKSRTNWFRNTIMVFNKLQKPNDHGSVSDKGFWQGNSSHVFDEGLSKDLLEFYTNEKAKSILDLGCGKCTYAQKLQQKGFYVQGYDGNPQTPLISKFGKVLDLTEQHDLGKQFDWVQSFEVGEHVPTDYQDKFIGNIVRHAKKGVIISWAIPSQGGWGHINNKVNEQVINKLIPLGFTFNQQKSMWFRKNRTNWFVNTIMVFYKN